jgi:protein TonB
VPDVVEVINIVEDDVIVESVDINTEDDKNKEVVIAAPVAAPVEEEDNVVFQVVETMPAFPGGDQALFKFLGENVKYPVIAQENGIQGRVICQFVVNKDGSIVDVEVVRPVDPSLDKEAIRVIKSMPNWSPGKQRGKSVRVKYTLPVNFKLQ